MHIQTFQGSNSDLSMAIAEAEEGAQILLDSLGRQELIQLTAQTLVEFTETANSYYSHIITVVYE